MKRWLIQFGIGFGVAGSLLLVIAAFPYPASAATLAKAPNNLGLVGYWSMDDCRGATSTDSSGNGNTGTLVNFANTIGGSTSTWVTGNAAKRGCALNFDGVNDYVDTKDIDIIDGSTALTLSAWIKTNNRALEQDIVSKWTYATQGTFAMDVGTVNPGQISVWLPTSLTDDGNGDRTETVAAVVPTGVWTHVVMVFDGSLTGNANRKKIYINGASVATTQGLGNVPAVLTSGGTAPVRIGQWNGLGRPFNGSIDEVRIYNRALSASEVTALYGAGATKIRALNNAGLVGYWSFDDARGATSTDQSGNGHTGTNVALGANAGQTFWSQGKRAGDLFFDGNDYVDIGNALNFEQDNPLTISFWTKFTTTDAYFIDKRALSGQLQGYEIFEINNYPGIVWRMGRNDISGGRKYCRGDTNINDGQWHFVAVTNTSGANCAGVKIYTDGRSNTLTTLDTGTATTTNSSDLSIGHPISFGASVSSGAKHIDEVRIYNRALSATEVTALYGSGVTKIVNVREYSVNPLFPPDAVAAYKFNSSTGLLTDATGRGNTLTNTNGVTTSEGKIGEAASFVTSSLQTLSIVTSTDLGHSAVDYEEVAWVYLDSNATSSGLFGYGSFNRPKAFISYNASTNLFQVDYRNVSNMSFSATTFGAASSSKWYFVDFYYSEASSTLALGINGVFNTVSSTITGGIGTDPRFWFGFNPATNWYLSGRIDAFAKWKRLLTAQERKNLYTPIP